VELQDIWENEDKGVVHWHPECMYCTQKFHTDFFFDNFLGLSCSLYCCRWSGERVWMIFLLHALIVIVDSGYQMPWISWIFVCSFVRALSTHTSLAVTRWRKPSLLSGRSHFKIWSKNFLWVLYEHAYILSNFDQQHSKGRISFTADIWSNANLASFLAVTSH
jgi:hypothetical protein